MARNTIFTHAAPEEVFDVLDDATAYPGWVVGTRRVRAVDPSWPNVGSRFHHAIGSQAGELHDFSTLLARDRPRMITLEVYFRPFGTARVHIRVHAAPQGSTI